MELREHFYEKKNADSIGAGTTPNFTFLKNMAVADGNNACESVGSDHYIDRKSVV